MVLAAIGKGRVWCNWICPAGTLFSALSAKSVCRHKVGEGCANCRACFAKAETSAKAQDGGNGVTRRDALQGVAVLAAAEAVEKTTDGGFAEVSLPLVPKRPASIMPPGALNRRRFNAKCVACGRCIKACPSGILRQSVALKSFGQPEMFFQNDFCRTACAFKCAKACPVGALVPGEASEKGSCRVGLAHVEKDLCIRTTEGVECVACSRKCPKGAITVVDGLPRVDVKLCVGCGACEHVCAARPEPAIRVSAAD
jgi:ferredoxin